MNKQCIGKCPYCGSGNINYFQSTAKDDYLVYPQTCLDCKKTFEEYSLITYAFTEFEEIK